MAPRHKKPGKIQKLIGWLLLTALIVLSLL